MKLDVKQLVIDTPTTTLLQFMWKNFHLSKLVNQGNNFVIYEEFFDECKSSIFIFKNYLFLINFIE
jgi:hypothetical protein